MKKLIAMIAVSLAGFTAQADNNNLETQPVLSSARPVWACVIGFEGHSRGLQILVGRFHSHAVGEIRCSDAMGGTYVRPVQIVMKTQPLALSVGVGDFYFGGVTAQISLFNAHPDVLLGDYVVARGHAALVAGAGAFTAVKADLPQLALQVSVQVGAGWGAHLGVQRMRIEAL